MYQVSVSCTLAQPFVPGLVSFFPEILDADRLKLGPCAKPVSASWFTYLFNMCRYFWGWGANAAADERDDLLLLKSARLDPYAGSWQVHEWRLG